MELIYQKWHSVGSDGFETVNGETRAVYHVCLNCWYLEDITKRGNRKLGRGKDGEGKARKLCTRCSGLINDNKCRAVLTIR